MTELAQTSLPVGDAVGLSLISLADANGLLELWQHYLGPVNRPFGSQAWALTIDGIPISVAVSASAVSATVAEYSRSDVVELARLCTAPAQRWATRPMLRLWREVAARRWPYWSPRAAIAYSQNARHDGQLYRFDGWTRDNDHAGSNGGGAWSRPRTTTDAVHGRKTLWIYRYDDAQEALH